MSFYFFNFKAKSIRLISLKGLLVLSLWMAGGCSLKELDSDISITDLLLRNDLTKKALPGTPTVFDVKQNVKIQQALDVSITKKPEHGELAFLNSGLILYMPNPEFTIGDDSFTYKVCQGDGTCQTGVYRVNYVAGLFMMTIDDLRGGMGLAYTTYQNVPVTETAPFTLLESIGMVFTDVKMIDPPKGGVFSIEGMKTTYKPSDGFKGLDYFVLSALEKNTNQTYYLPVKVVVRREDARLICWESFKMPWFQTHFVSGEGKQDDALLIDLQGYAIDVCGIELSDRLRFNVLQNPKKGVLTNENNVLKYLPNANAEGNDEIKYQVCVDGVECFENVFKIKIKKYNKDIACKINSQNDFYTFAADSLPIEKGYLKIQADLLTNDMLCMPSQGQSRVLGFLGNAQGMSVTAVRNDHAQVSFPKDFRGTFKQEYRLCVGADCSESLLSIEIK